MLRKYFLIVGQMVLAVVLVAVVVYGVSQVLQSHKIVEEARFKAEQAAKAASKPVTIQPDVKDTTKWAMAFQDDFSAPTLNRQKWSTCYEWFDAANSGCTNPGNKELQWYLDNQIAIKDGNLVLTADKNPVTVNKNGAAEVYPYRSGMVSTGRPDLNSGVKWQGSYGFYEARIKLEAGRGKWPAFWLLPTDKQWPPEIDIMEFLGHNPKEVLMTYHWADADGKHKEDSSYIKSDVAYTDDWHIYAVNWQPGRIDWYIDGILKKSETSLNIPGKPMQLILNLAVGGHLPGNPDASSKFPTSMSVDYVRVYGMKF
jgi:beta-glucanase (GH16 family)